jgi:hypothetical protein
LNLFNYFQYWTLTLCAQDTARSAIKLLIYTSCFGSKYFLIIYQTMVYRRN